MCTRSDLLATRQIVLIVVCALMPVSARANGGPVEEPPAHAARGGIAPIDETDITLVSEDLTITLREEEYPTASARYVLRNPGSARRVLFGIPLRYPQHTFEDSVDDGRSVAEGIKDIRIAFLGKTVGCELKRGATRRDRSVDAWCITPLDIPAGEVALGLDYTLASGRAWLASHMEVSILSYPLWPAGYWKGSVAHFSIRVDAGEQTGDAIVVSPPGARADGLGFSWRFENAELKVIREILIRFPISQIKKRSYGGYIRERATASASATSTLPREGRFSYEAMRAVDVDDKTAWCEGVSGDGVGESLTVRLGAAVPRDGTCEILDFTLTPGFARDEKTFQANGRVTKARIESCRDHSKGFDVVLMNPNPLMNNLDINVVPGRPGDHADDSHVNIFAPAGALGGENECVRLVILEVRPGAEYHDTCISEFEPRLYCRKSEPTPPKAVP